MGGDGGAVIPLLPFTNGGRELSSCGDDGELLCLFVLKKIEGKGEFCKYTGFQWMKKEETRNRDMIDELKEKTEKEKKVREGRGGGGKGTAPLCPWQYTKTTDPLTHYPQGRNRLFLG